MAKAWPGALIVEVLPFNLCSREESNLDFGIRNPMSYPPRRPALAGVGEPTALGASALNWLVLGALSLKMHEPTLAEKRKEVKLK